MCAVKQATAEIQCRQSVKSLFAMWSSGQVAKLDDGQDFLTPVAAVTMVAAPITALAKNTGGWCLSGVIAQ